MKVGNKTHAIALSVIGVLAIVALVVQMKAKMGSTSTLQVAARTVAPAAAPAVPAGLPHMVYGDPFTHPKLPRLAALKTNDAVESEHVSAKAPRPLAGNMEYSPVLPNLLNNEVTADKGSSPAPRLPLLCLQAVVSAPDYVAFISFDGKEPREFTVGEQVAKDVTVVRIVNGEITLRILKETKTLSVGGKLQL